jgi:hypothetical protein
MASIEPMVVGVDAAVVVAVVVVVVVSVPLLDDSLAAVDVVEPVTSLFLRLSARRVRPRAAGDDERAAKRCDELDVGIVNSFGKSLSTHTTVVISSSNTLTTIERYRRYDAACDVERDDWPD